MTQFCQQQKNRLSGLHEILKFLHIILRHIFDIEI